MTDSTLDKITLLDVVRVAGVVVSEHPDRKNPFDLTGLSGTMRCLYTAPDGSHCIGGEVLVRLGCELPAEHEPVDATPDFGRFKGGSYGDALEFLQHLQTHADTGGDARLLPVRDRRVTWSEAFRSTVTVFNDKIEEAQSRA